MQGYRDINSSIAHFSKEPLPLPRQLSTVTVPYDVNARDPTDFVVAPFSQFLRLSTCCSDILFISIIHDSNVPAFLRLLNHIQAAFDFYGTSRIMIYCPIRVGDEPTKKVLSIMSRSITVMPRVVVLQ